MPPPNRPPFTLVLGRRPRRHDPWVICAALVPLAPMLVVGLGLVRARVVLGEWSLDALFRTSEYGLGLPPIALAAAVNLALVSPLLTAGVAVIRWVLHGGRYRLGFDCTLAALLWSAGFAWIRIDPGALVALALGAPGI